MRARRLLYAASARRDLASIRAYFSREASPQVAARLLGRIRKAIASARETPQAGTPRPEYDPACRFVTARPYVVYYVVAGETVTIVRVLHWAQDREAIMSDKA